MTVQELAREVESQREWMAHCGGSLAGYIVKYGSVSDTEHYGDGGEAIYAADRDALLKLEDSLAIARSATKPSPIGPYDAVKRARAILERVDFPEGGEDWSLLANATTALDMILDRRPK